MTSSHAQASSESTPLTEGDLCIIASVVLAERAGGRVIGSDKDISDAIVRGLGALGLSPGVLPWQLSITGTWYLSAAAEFSDRLAALKWATADSPYRFTPEGAEACRSEYDRLSARLGSEIIERLRIAMAA